MTLLSPLLAQFFHDWLESTRRASRNTFDSYEAAFRLLLGFVSERVRTDPTKLALEQIDAETITAFLEHLETSRGNGPTTRNARLAAIKSFFKYVEHRVPSAIDQVRKVCAIPAKKADQRLVVHLDHREARALVDAPDPTDYLGIRDRAILLTFVCTGLRVSELTGLRLADVHLGPNPVLNVLGKGRRHRVMPLAAHCAKALKEWLAVRGARSTDIVFLNHRGAPITRSGIADMLKRRCRSAAAKCPALVEKRVHPHALRHTAAMQVLASSGGDLRRVALWLGHASIQTTEVYTRADLSEKLAAMEKMLPFPVRRGRFKVPKRLFGILRSPAELAAPLCGVARPDPAGGMSRDSS